MRLEQTKTLIFNPKELKELNLLINCDYGIFYLEDSLIYNNDLQLENIKKEHLLKDDVKAININDIPKIIENKLNVNLKDILGGDYFVYLQPTSQSYQFHSHTPVKLILDRSMEETL